MKLKISLLFWHILCANLGWALACFGTVWYIFNNDPEINDVLWKPFLIFHIFIGWIVGLITGLTQKRV
jgi:hypothetical protein